LHTRVEQVAIELKGCTADDLIERAVQREMNVRKLSSTSIGIAVDETTTLADVRELAELMGAPEGAVVGDAEGGVSSPSVIEGTKHARTTDFLVQDVFNKYHSETEMMRSVTSSLP
jgi:glycine dehydrogenase